MEGLWAEFLTSPRNGVRCSLSLSADGDKVTAVAIVTNDGNVAQPWENRQNQSGDAVVVGSVYQQVPSEIALMTAGVQQVDRATEGAPFPCSETETVKVLDQVGRGMAGVNVDVHATGPSDALQFDHDSSEIWTDTQAPDRGVHSLEPAYDCISFPANSDPGEQGDHQRFGAADRKHVEVQASGTSDIGQFNFAMRSPVEGETQWTAWVDELDDGCAANDDTFVQGEVFVTGGIGWGRPGSSSDPQPYEPLVACSPPGGSTPPPIEESPDEDPERNRSVRLRLDGTPAAGTIGRFVGRIVAERTVCEQAQKVILKVRRPGESYRVIARTRTDGQGRFTLEKRIRAPRDYRAVAPATVDCARASSRAIRLRAG